MIESLKPSRTALARMGVAGVALATSVGIAACGGGDSEGSTGGGSIDLVAYSTPQQAFEKGMITDSVVVFSVRPGNPEGIEDWDDLVSGDVEIITPNPATSGGAKWNIMAAYGSQIAQGASEQEALDFVAQILENTSVLDDSARDSVQTFASGKGDVLIGYENEAIQAQDEGVDLDYIIPDDTILIENPAAVTADAQDPEASQALLDYIWTDEGQQTFADYGYRPVVKSVLEDNPEKLPDVPGLFTIEEFGGWDKVDTEFFDDASGSVTRILQEQG